MRRTAGYTVYDLPRSAHKLKEVRSASMCANVLSAFICLTNCILCFRMLPGIARQCVARRVLIYHSFRITRAPDPRPTGGMLWTSRSMGIRHSHCGQQPVYYCIASAPFCNATCFHDAKLQVRSTEPDQLTKRSLTANSAAVDRRRATSRFSEKLGAYSLQNMCA